MKKVSLAAIIAVTGLALFSFRGIEDTKDFNPIQLKSLEHQTKSFVKSCRVFSDKFTYWREEWTEISKMQMQNEGKVLNKF